MEWSFHGYGDEVEVCGAVFGYGDGISNSEGWRRTEEEEGDEDGKEYAHD